jgi:hypothetical protein
LRATGIFTGTTSSPCQLARQSHFRYAIRAGRNLPDKEFRSTLLRPLLSNPTFMVRMKRRGFSISEFPRPLSAMIGLDRCTTSRRAIWTYLTRRPEPLRDSFQTKVEWTFLPLSACRHAVRTVSFPTNSSLESGIQSLRISVLIFEDVKNLY